MTVHKHIAGLAFLVAGAVALAVVQDAVTLRRVVKEGDAAKYRLKADIDLAGEKATLTAVLNEKVSKVETDGSYTSESTMTDGKATFGGNEMPMDAQPAVITVTKANGEVVSVSGSEADQGALRLANIQTFRFPDKNVKVGDDWSVDLAVDAKSRPVAIKAEYKVEAQEKVGSFDTFKVKTVVKETTGAEPASADGFIWVNIADGSMVKYEATWNNPPFAGLPGQLTAKVSIVRE